MNHPKAKLSCQLESAYEINFEPAFIVSDSKKSRIKIKAPVSLPGLSKKDHWVVSSDLTSQALQASGCLRRHCYGWPEQ